MMGAMKAALAVICSLTLLATGYLSLSLYILRPPRANFQQWGLIAAVITAQGALTLVALMRGSAGGPRYFALAGGFGIAWIGARSVYNTLSGPHFEGYALVLGSMLLVQGLLTLTVFLRLQDFRMAGPQD
jgi:hypothetical protein